jgi:uncharacterized protein YidB (DUF937 family)
MSDTQQEHDRQTGQAPQAAPQEAQQPQQGQGQGQQGQPNLGSMISGLLGGQGGGAVAKLVPAVLGMVSASGGLGGLLEKLKQGGLGEQTKSWVSPDAANAKVSGDQLTDALGQEHMDKLAEQAGVSPQEAAGGLAQMLPGAVDKLTPQGEVPKDHGGFDLDQVKAQVAKLLGGNR